MSMEQVAGNGKLGAGRRESKARRIYQVEESRELEIKSWEQAAGN